MVAALCLITVMAVCAEPAADSDTNAGAGSHEAVCLSERETEHAADRDMDVDTGGFAELLLPEYSEPGYASDSSMESAFNGLAEYLLPRDAKPEQGSAFAAFGGLQLSGDLPARWYAGDYGRRPTQKYQGNYGTCWALTAVSALEAAVLPGQRAAFSADHMANRNAYTVDVDAGGSYQMVMAYLSGWQGPVTEAEDPYGDGFSPDGLEAAAHVQEMQLLDGCSTDEIKQAVREYGAVQTSLYMSREQTQPDSPYYNEGTYAYCYPREQTQNHDVLILGWDDLFSRFRFRSIPECDGAFICMNWWSGFGDDSIFYVSYGDANIARTGLVCSRVEAADNYDRLYQADDCGWMGSLGYGSRECWFANVYTAAAADEAASDTDGRSANAGTSGSGSGAASVSETKTEAVESLSAVGFYATAPGGTYDIYLVHDFSDASSFTSMEHLATAEAERCGYYTVDLEKPEQLSSGERFAVIVKMTVPKGRAAAAVEFAGSPDAADVTLEGQEGYLSRKGHVWENTEEAYRSNVCLKAYTTYR